VQATSLKAGGKQLCLLCYSILKMEAKHSSETKANLKNTRYCIPEDETPHKKL
jgi:hypothetical protein